MPGYRWFELNDDGTFDSGVERVPSKDYGVDFASVGY
jgi:Icc protein